MTEASVEQAAAREKLVEEIIDVLDGGTMEINWHRTLYPIANAMADLVATREREARRQGMEEAAVIASNPYGDEVEALGPDEPSMVGKKIAAAIRARAQAEEGKG